MEFVHGLPAERADLLARVEALAATFAPRADQHDRDASFPVEDFSDLFREGLLAAALPVALGGLGVGPLNADLYTLWMITRAFARVDLSLARCWEGHQNSLVLIHGLGSQEQQRRWLAGVLEKGEIWVAWSGEPTARAPSERSGVGTTLTRVPGGYRINGSKVFATSATHATWAILLISRAGPGGARHSQGSPSEVLMMACDLRDPSVGIDRRWWDPVGMRGTASHMVTFNDTFVPDEDLIGSPGQYLLEDWQTRFTPHYAASFLGAAEGALDYARGYLGAQNKAGNPFIQQHLGKMQMNVHTGHLWLRHVANLWEQGADAEARLAGSRARYLIEHLTEETFQHCIRACGARCFIRPSALERAWRDVNFYFRHDNDDHILAMLGRATLGVDVDASFFRPGNAR